MEKLRNLALILFVAVFITACGAGGGGDTNTNNPGASDTTKPTVSQTSPANGATGVAVNSAISLTFSEAVDSTSVSTSTFQVSGISGAVSVNGTTATFTPSSNLGYNTPYTVTLTTGIKDSAGNAMDANYTCSFTTGALADTTPPTVSSVNPANNATDMAVNASVTATFSETMSSSTFNSTTFSLKQGATPVSGAVTYSGTTATFTPSSSLAYSTTYTATITTGVKDAAGNAMVANYSWSFMTGSAPDTTPPTVSSTNPANNTTGVAVNSAITATFSETMDTSSITTATFYVGGVSGTVTYSGTTATFTPSFNLSYSTTYTATITRGAKDAAGNAVATNYTWSFTTGTAPDTTPPTISSTSFANNATGVAINSAVTAIFSENMDSSTVTTSSFILKQGATTIAGTVTYNGTTATFTPSSNLSYSTTYIATITTDIKDAAGNALASSYSWSFTTANKFVTLTGTYKGVAKGSVFGTDDVTITISVVDSTLIISGAQFFDGTCNYSASISTDGLSVSNGTYQCSDFSSGTWTLTQMKAVDTNDVYISLLKDGSQVKKMYGMTGSSTTGTGTVIKSVNQLVGTYRGVANHSAFVTDDVTITISVVDSTLIISGAQFFDGTCNYSASISTDGLSVSNGTYQCSDFSSGTWTLTQMKTVDTNDVYISLLKDGSHVKKMYGMK